MSDLVPSSSPLAAFASERARRAPSQPLLMTLAVTYDNENLALSARRALTVTRNMGQEARARISEIERGLRVPNPGRVKLWLLAVAVQKNPPDDLDAKLAAYVGTLLLRGYGEGCYTQEAIADAALASKFFPDIREVSDVLLARHNALVRELRALRLIASSAPSERAPERSPLPEAPAKRIVTDQDRAVARAAVEDVRAMMRENTRVMDESRPRPPGVIGRRPISAEHQAMARDANPRVQEAREQRRAASLAREREEEERSGRGGSYEFSDAHEDSDE